MIAKASKEDLAETARILAMQAAHMTRKLEDAEDARLCEFAFRQHLGR